MSNIQKLVLTLSLILLVFNTKIKASVLEFHLTSEYFNQKFSLSVTRISDSIQNIYIEKDIESEVKFSVINNQKFSNQYDLYTFVLTSVDSQRQINFILYLNNSSQSSIKILKDGNLDFKSSDSLSVNCLYDLIKLDENYSIENVLRFIEKYECHNIIFIVLDFAIELLLKEQPHYFTRFVKDCYVNSNSLAYNAFQEKLKSYQSMSNSQLYLSPFKIMDINQQEFYLQDLIDSTKKTVIYVWASWCGPCIKTIKTLEGNNLITSTDSVKFIFISIDKNLEKWQEVSSSYSHLINSYLIPTEQLEKFISTFNSQFIPSTYLFNTNKLLVQWHFDLLEYIKKEKVK